MNRVLAYLLFTVLLIDTSKISFGQEELHTNFEEKLRLQDSTDEQVILVEVVDGISSLSVKFNGLISSGEIEVVLYDPDGINLTKFSLINTSKKKNKKNSVAIRNRKQKTFTFPKVGVWELVISYYDATGEVDVNVFQLE